MKPPASRDQIRIFCGFLTQQEPFVFVRFSDGEMEIIRNETLIIGDGQIRWRLGTFESSLPTYDSKTFVPEDHQDFRAALIAAAEFRASNYFKGVPTRHNGMISDRDLMVQLNGGSAQNLTYSDLFLNSNYRVFMSKVVPLFESFRSVVVVGNFRMRPALHNVTWRHIEIPDDFIPRYETVIDTIIPRLENLPKGSLVLSSASSLTNLLGHHIAAHLPQVTLIDIGTSMHHLMGLDSSIRGYQIELHPWTRVNARRKLRYKLSRSYRPKW